MSLSYTKKLFSVLGILVCCSNELTALTTLTKNDPYPVFTSLDPQTFLHTRTKLRLKGYELDGNWTEHVGISISPFGQNANDGRTIDDKFVELGDINGKWDMLALVYGDLPQGQTLGPKLAAAQATLFPGGLGLNDPDYIDKNKNVAFFTIPLTYRKRGLRFEFDANLASDFGISVQTGIADMCQTVTAFNNLTPDCSQDDWKGNSCCNRPINKCDINKSLMDELKPIAKEINLNINNFHQFSIEEVRINGYWRHAIEINKNEEEWPEFLLIPYAQVSGSISPGKEKDANMAFAVPFGNNRFNSVGFNTGLNFDFFDTIEIGGDVGYTHFFQRNCMDLRVPNSCLQSGIFPFSTAVNYQPGDNWNFGGKIAAYHFLGKLSMYFQYIWIGHAFDRICLVNPDPAFKPEALEKISDWKAQLINTGFNYDLSPNLGLGFLWQAPIGQRNVYKSTTVLFSFYATF